MPLVKAFFSRPTLVYIAAIVLRIVLLVYGRWQDTHSPVKYTDIDYLVFTDAARFVSEGGSPYDRATYRYTPLLAWILLPTTWGGLWFEFGKCLFALGDIVTGALSARILLARGMSVDRAMKYASIWLLNPMVANISTRGSSEGLVVVIVIALLWAVLERKHSLAGFLLGMGVHVKIYPFIYAPSILWYMVQISPLTLSIDGIVTLIRHIINRNVIKVAIAGAATTLINILMYYIYGMPFVEHTYLYHFTRIDHRHNFSVYNTILHSNSARGVSGGRFSAERLAFIPQLSLSFFAIPFILAKGDLAGTMLAQTFAFVTFNKVCTSQYFLWYMVFLPFYLPESSFIKRPRLGWTALFLWVASQAIWLEQAYELEFLGRSTFYPGLFAASVLFFLINCWILGVILSDLGEQAPETETKAQAQAEVESARKSATKTIKTH